MSATQHDLSKVTSSQAIAIRLADKKSEQEANGEYPCPVWVDLGERCGKEIACVAREPWTPAAHATECCEEHALEMKRYDGYAINRYCPGVSQTCDTEIPMDKQLCGSCQREANGESHPAIPGLEEAWARADEQENFGGK